MSLATRVVVFQSARARKIVRGSPREARQNRRVIAAYLGTRAAKAAACHTSIELMGDPRLTRPLLKIDHLEGSLWRPDRAYPMFH